MRKRSSLQVPAMRGVLLVALLGWARTQDGARWPSNFRGMIASEIVPSSVRTSEVAGGRRIPLIKHATEEKNAPHSEPTNRVQQVRFSEMGVVFRRPIFGTPLQIVRA